MHTLTIYITYFYCFKVIANNSLGASDPESTSNFTYPLPPNLTVNNITNVTVLVQLDLSSTHQLLNVKVYLVVYVSEPYIWHHIMILLTARVTL